MRAIALIILCLAYSGYGRRVQRQADVEDHSNHEQRSSEATHGQKAFSTLLQALNPAAGFQGNVPMAGAGSIERSLLRCGDIAMKKWDRRRTLAEQIGGAGDQGHENVGLLGTIPVVFTCGEDVIKTKAMVGQPLSEVAAQSGQWIKYKCKKGQCGTCDVRIGGEWVHTCQHKIPYVPDGESYEVFVRDTMKKAKRSSRFYSFKSLIAGAKNNILGMVGFVRDARRSKENFNTRLNKEDDIMALAEARRKAKAGKAKKEKQVEEVKEPEQVESR